MSATKKLLDKYRQVCLGKNDNGIAKSLGVSRAAVSRWVNDQGHPNPEAIEQMARAINETPGPWIVQIEAERAHTPGDKKVWLRLAASLGVSLAITAVILPKHAQAIDNYNNSGLSIVSNILLRLIRRLTRGTHQTAPAYA